VLGPIAAMNVIILSGLVGASFTVKRALKFSQKRITLFYSLGLCVGVFIGLNFLFDNEITQITFYMGVFILVGTLILFSGWRYKGPQTRAISLGFGWDNRSFLWVLWSANLDPLQGYISYLLQLRKI
jgi:hypothetical protein